MYVREQYLCGESIEVEEKHTGKYGAPGVSRTKRKEPTPEQIARQNQWRRERDVRRLLKCNFVKDDLWVTLTYRRGSRPDDFKQAKNDIQKFINRMKYRYKKAGEEFRYIVITEVGKRGGIHHHMVMNRIQDADRMIAEQWKYGGAVHELIRTTAEDYKRLADYIAKQPAEDNAIKDKWFSRSRNLKQPEVKRQIMKRRTFSEEIRPKKGYVVVKESIYSGTNPITGHLYRHYTMERINRRC